MVPPERAHTYEIERIVTVIGVVRLWVRSVCRAVQGLGLLVS